jgi:hypothetical protein
MYSPTPSKKTPTPIKRTPTPIKRTPTPVKRTPTPIKRTPTPTPIKRTPTPIKRTPTPTPVKRTPTPVKRTPTPSKKTPTPVKILATPSKRTPTPGKRTPTPSKKTPTINKTIKKQLINALTKAKESVLTRKLQTIRTKHAEKTIKKFMLNPTVREKNTALFLNSICSDSGVCIAFGQESLKIKKYFNDFTDFTYLHSPITKIVIPSENGFLYELEYIRQTYKAYAILKSNQSKENDNLMYEYFVGMAVNNFCKELPCFIETYGLFNYKTNADWLKLKNDEIDKTDVLINKQLNFIKKPTFDMLNEGCGNAKYQCILIQHLKDTKSLANVVTQPLFINNHLICLLYIIYFSLAAVDKVFTHYDLHASNVLIYTPNLLKYIEYVFYDKQPGKDLRILKFKSIFIPKLIDYGHSFYSINASNNSQKIYDKLCTLDECKPHCGWDQGFNWLKANQHFINCSKRNVSHDLRLMDILKDYVNVPTVNINIKRLINKTDYKENFGTPELNLSGLPYKINNVTDACYELSNMVMMQEPALSDSLYAGDEYSSCGELHVYFDGTPMRFINK